MERKAETGERILVDVVLGWRCATLGGFMLRWTRGVEVMDRSMIYGRGL